MMLELGVPRTTDMSFISLGISRSTTRAIAATVVNGTMTPLECRAWLLGIDPESLDAPTYAVREISEFQKTVADRRKLDGPVVDWGTLGS
jgi:hypothetical protein